MLVDLQQVPPEGQDIDRAVDSSRLSSSPSEFRLRHAARVTGRVMPLDGNAYRIRGKLLASLDVGCVRCLASYPMEILETLDLLYLPQSENVARDGEDDRELEENELDVAYYRADAIDLGHVVLEQIVLALPMKPVCRADCRGLCQQCGANLNETRCECEHDTVDPRWQSLKSLLEP